MIPNRDKLKKRLDSIVKIFNNGKFPIQHMILGFGRVRFKSNDECLGAIKELSLIVEQPLEVDEIFDKNDKGETIARQIIKIKEEEVICNGNC